MSYTCDRCHDSGYIRSTPPVEACPYCERGRCVSEMLSGASPVTTRQKQRSFFANRFSGRRLRATQAQAPHLPAAPARLVENSGTQWWTPARVEAGLKVAIYLGAALALYFLTRGSSTGIGAQETAGASLDDNFSSWEPQV